MLQAKLVGLVLMLLIVVSHSYADDFVQTKTTSYIDVSANDWAEAFSQGKPLSRMMREFNLYLQLKWAKEKLKRIPSVLFEVRNKMPEKYQLVLASFVWDSSFPEQRDWGRKTVERYGKEIFLSSMASYSNDLGFFSKDGSTQEIKSDKSNFYAGSSSMSLNLLHNWIRLFPKESWANHASLMENLIYLYTENLDRFQSNARAYDEKTNFLNLIDFNLLQDFMTPEKFDYVMTDAYEILKKMYADHTFVEYSTWGFSVRKRTVEKRFKARFPSLKRNYVSAIRRNRFQFISRFSEMYEDGVLNFDDFEDLRWTKGMVRELISMQYNEKLEALNYFLINLVVLENQNLVEEASIRRATKDMLDHLKRSKLAATGLIFKSAGKIQTFLEFDDYHKIYKRLLSTLSIVPLTRAQIEQLEKVKIPKPEDLPEAHYSEILWTKYRVLEKHLGREEFIARSMRLVGKSPKEIKSNLNLIQFINQNYPDTDLSWMLNVVDPKFLKLIDANRDDLDKQDKLWSNKDFFMLKLMALFDPGNIYLLRYLEEIYFNGRPKHKLDKLDALFWLVKLKKSSSKLEKQVRNKLLFPGVYQVKPYFEAYLKLFPENSKEIASILAAHSRIEENLGQMLDVLLIVGPKTEVFMESFTENRMSSQEDGVLNWKYDGLYLDEWIEKKTDYKKWKCSKSASLGVNI